MESTSTANLLRNYVDRQRRATRRSGSSLEAEAGVSEVNILRLASLHEFLDVARNELSQHALSPEEAADTQGYRTLEVALPPQPFANLASRVTGAQWRSMVRIGLESIAQQQQMSQDGEWRLRTFAVVDETRRHKMVVGGAKEEAEEAEINLAQPQRRKLVYDNKTYIVILLELVDVTNAAPVRYVEGQRQSEGTGLGAEMQQLLKALLKERDQDSSGEQGSGASAEVERLRAENAATQARLARLEALLEQQVGGAPATDAAPAGEEAEPTPSAPEAAHKVETPPAVEEGESFDTSTPEGADAYYRSMSKKELNAAYRDLLDKSPARRSADVLIKELLAMQFDDDGGEADG